MKKVYLVDMHQIIDKEKKEQIIIWNNEEFKQEAKKQGKVYTIYEFQEVFNMELDSINNQHQWIRILD